MVVEKAGRQSKTMRAVPFQARAFRDSAEKKNSKMKQQDIVHNIRELWQIQKLTDMHLLRGKALTPCCERKGVVQKQGEMKMKLRINQRNAKRREMLSKKEFA
jgi:hypothetical protein